MHSTELTSDERVNDIGGWGGGGSQVKYGCVEMEVIVHPSIDFSRNMEYMSLEVGGEIQVGNSHFLLDTDHSHTGKVKVSRQKIFP